MTNYLKFWGTRGSCPVAGPEYVHFGGNTPSLELRYENQLIIFDSGTGIRPLGFTLKNETKINLFISHFHWDHILGFPFFRPLYREGVEIHIWSPQRNARELFNQIFAKEFFPVHIEEVKAKLSFHTIEAHQPIQMGPLSIDFHPTRHPGQTLCFKINTPTTKIGYVTDNEINLKEQKSFINFHKEVDLFIHEAQYSQSEYEKRIGWGHSSLASVLELIEHVRPKKWLVTHHDPRHTDDDLRALEQLAQSTPLPCSVEWITDGQIVLLN